MKRHKIYHYPLALRLKPLTTFGPAFQRRVCDTTEFCYRSTEVIVEMRAKIITDVMKACVFRLELNVFAKHSTECFGVMILATFTENISGFRAKEGYEICGAVSAVVEFCAQRMPLNCRKIRRQPLDSLNARALIKAK